MAYYSSPRKYEAVTGKRFTDKCSCIHRTGSVKGMGRLGFWNKDSDKVRHGSWIYQQPEIRGNCNLQGRVVMTNKEYIERYKKYVKIAERAEKEGLYHGDRINLLMDIESADLKFNL